MPTRSFTDTFIINKEQLARLYEILRDAPKIDVKEIEDHKDVKGDDIAKMLGLS